ncbi:hypothetical protein UFOVP360_9 [uncultured Caudovirales phage]|uniref:Uncharacterized protein n=1 Tax=uncultured Caudovirales phage TaxID=2100421 RepID=A0A6J7WZJ0_9CAUD|nr:hypothetical protein UFOVP360_9 [uncultured Caudovirales phage]
MPATYEPIQTYTLGSSASSITFSSIASSWTDLKLVVVPLAASSADGWDMLLRFNNDSSSLYSSTLLRGNGSSADSSRYTSVTSLKSATGLNQTIPFFWSYDIFSYAGSTNKTALYSVSADTNGGGVKAQWVGLYRSTTAISRIDILPEVGSFNTGTTATLYGIKNA